MDQGDYVEQTGYEELLRYAVEGPHYRWLEDVASGINRGTLASAGIPPECTGRPDAILDYIGNMLSGTATATGAVSKSKPRGFARGTGGGAGGGAGAGAGANATAGTPASADTTAPAMPSGHTDTKAGDETEAVSTPTVPRVRRAAVFLLGPLGGGKSSLLWRLQNREKAKTLPATVKTDGVQYCE